MSEIPRTIRIVVVEDHAPDVFLLKEALRDAAIPFELTHFDQGDAAVKSLSAENAVVPDLLILDLNLPGITGIEILRHVRRTPRLAHLPAAILTSSQAPQDRADALSAGADLFIHKPTGYDGFVSTVGGAIRGLLQQRLLLV